MYVDPQWPAPQLVGRRVHVVGKPIHPPHGEILSPLRCCFNSSTPFFFFLFLFFWLLCYFINVVSSYHTRHVAGLYARCPIAFDTSGASTAAW